MKSHQTCHWYANLQYNEILKQLGLMRLERRRVRSDLIETCKIMNGKYDINRELFFQLDEGGRRGVMNQGPNKDRAVTQTSANVVLCSVCRNCLMFRGH